MRLLTIFLLTSLQLFAGSQYFYNDAIFKTDVNLESQDASTALMLDADKNIISSLVSSTELNYLAGLTSNLQDQLDARVELTESEAVSLGGDVTLSALTASKVLYLDASKLIKTSSVSDTTLSYLDATSSVQGQLNNKVDLTETSAVELQNDLKLSSLTASTAIYLDATGIIKSKTTVSDTELGYLSAVTSDIQAQINGKLTSPLTTNGDIMYYNSSAHQRLGVANNGDVLTLVAGLPSWQAPTGGGGGGGSTIIWHDTTSPASVEGLDTTRNVLYRAFLDNNTQKLAAEYKVPSSYVATNPIALICDIYGSAGSVTLLLTSQATLIRNGTDVLSSSTNQRTSTNTAQSITTAYVPYDITMDLTDGTGNINSVAVSAGDTIKIVLSRGTDTDTSYLYLLPYSCEITLQ